MTTKQKIIITGATGRLGKIVANELEQHQNHQVIKWNHAAENLTDKNKIIAVFNEIKPNIVVHLAAAGATKNPEEIIAVNTNATETLAQLCQKIRARLIYTSTDMVFDGINPPFSETSSPNPINLYGKSKLAGETAIHHCTKNFLILRLATLYGVYSEDPTRDFFSKALHHLRENETIAAYDDEYRTPISYQRVTKIISELLLSEFTGTLHVGGHERLSRYEMCLEMARALNVSTNLVKPTKMSDQLSGRPRDLSLDTSLLQQLHLQNAKSCFKDELKFSLARVAP